MIAVWIVSCGTDNGVFFCNMTVGVCILYISGSARQYENIGLQSIQGILHTETAFNPCAYCISMKQFRGCISGYGKDIIPCHALSALHVHLLFYEGNMKHYADIRLSTFSYSA